jgi:hypothetical protein
MDGNEYKIRKWLVLKFHGSGHLQIILHLNKITECLKMTTFNIVFTFDGFFGAETTCTADVLHSYLVFRLPSGTDTGNTLQQL